jgi:O-antigen/teichoic acid export membrane protein
VAPILINELFPKFSEAVDAIRIMSLVIIPTTISLILESEFLGNEKSRVVLIGTTILLTSLIIGMIVLGSMMGIEGIAYSLVIAQIAKLGFYLIAKKFSVT